MCNCIFRCELMLCMHVHEGYSTHFVCMSPVCWRHKIFIQVLNAKIGFLLNFLFST